MKKALSLILALVLCLGLCACDGPVEEEKEVVSETEKEEVIKYKENQTATSSLFECTLYNVSFA